MAVAAVVATAVRFRDIASHDKGGRWLFVDRSTDTVPDGGGRWLFVDRSPDNVPWRRQSVALLMRMLRLAVCRLLPRKYTTMEATDGFFVLRRGRRHSWQFEYRSTDNVPVMEADGGFF